MHEGMLTIGGYVGTDIEFSEGNGSGARAIFRIGSTSRWFDRASGSWRDQETVWLTVKAWRGLAHNVKASVRKGEPVIVTGKLRTTRWKDVSGEERTKLFVEATAIGHDLNRGTTAYRRTERMAPRDDDVDDIALMRRLEASGQTIGLGSAPEPASGSGPGSPPEPAAEPAAAWQSAST